jgi:ATP/ADP translocase/CRP-like cAMP-binding protein
MTSLLNRAMGPVVSLRAGETTVALLMFAYSFLAMTAYNIFKPLTRSQFIGTLGADNFPWVQLGAGLFIGMLMDLYARAVDVLPRRAVVPVTQLAIAGLLVVFWGVLHANAVWVSVAFYVFGLMIGLLLISQFWTLANDVYDARQAKRVFGFIGGGASLGGMAGAGVTNLLVDELGDQLLLISAVVLTACAVTVSVILRRQPGVEGASLAEERGVGGREALRLLAESPHLRIIALVIAMAAAGAAIVEQQILMAAEATHGAEAEADIAAFLSLVTVWVSGIAFVLQVALTSRMHQSLGLAFALLLLPLSLGTTAAVVLVIGTLWAPAVAKVIDSTLRYSIDKTTREVLFVPIPAELRFRAKPFIDVTVDRLSKAAAALLLLVLIKPWGLGLDWRRLSYASLVVMAVWVLTAIVARRGYLRAFRESIGARGIAPTLVRAEAADAATIETLVEELSNPDESAVLYAIDMLEAFDKRNLVSPLLLQHESPKVRARALLAMASKRSGIAGRWTATVERMVYDDDVDVRAAALRALAALSHEDASAVMHRHLDDAEPRVAVTAATVLAASDSPADLDAADRALTRLIGDTRTTAVAGRAEAARALAHITNPRFRSLLVPLIYDHDPQVVQEAIRSARVLGPSDGLFVPGLVSLLGHRAFKTAARDALVGYGEDAVEVLAHFLHESQEDAWVRRHIPATLASLPSQRSMDTLVSALEDPDGFLRYKVITAIEHLLRTRPRLAVPSMVLERRVVQETSRYYNSLTLRHNLTRSGVATSSLLGCALDDKLDRTLDRIYRLLGLLYGVDDVAAARTAITGGDGRKRAAALEYLDNLVAGTVRKHVIPILDDTTIDEKVRYANAVLKTRPRDLPDTLAQLIHDGDDVVAASAVHLAARHQVWDVADDLEFVIRRSTDGGPVADAALWALGLRDQSLPDGSAFPVVELADRIRAIPLFEFVSIDELFRIADRAQEVRHHAGRDLFHAGAPAEDVQLLVEGAVSPVDNLRGAVERRAPDVIGFEDVIQGTPRRDTLRATAPTVCFRVPASEFLTMVSDNTALAQGLFRMLLERRRSASTMEPRSTMAFDVRSQALQAVDYAMILRRHPLLARATAQQLLALTAATRDVPLKTGATLFDANDAPAMFVILQGEVLVEGAGAGSEIFGAGHTLGVAETLAGMAQGRRATVASAGRALRLERDAVFGVLADHVDLMQGLFGGVLAQPDSTSPSPSPPPMQAAAPGPGRTGGGV